MGKVKVNETVAGWIEKSIQIQGNDDNYLILGLILNEIVDGDWDISNQNITLTQLASAVENGYEVIYEAKPGDVISFINEGMEHLRTVLKVDDDVYWFTIDGCWSKGLCRIVSKKENREDFKKDE